MSVPQDNAWVDSIESVGDANWLSYDLPQIHIPDSEQASQFISRAIRIPWDISQWSLDFRESVIPVYQTGHTFAIHPEYQLEDSDSWVDFSYGTVFLKTDRIRYFRYVCDFVNEYQIQNPILDFVGHDLNNERIDTLFTQPHFKRECSYIRDGQPTTNYHGGDLLVGDIAGDELRILIKFPLDKYEARWELDNVWIDLFNTRSDTVECAVYRITSDWDEDAVTWNNRKTGTAWTTAGGDIDDLPLFTFSVDEAGWIEESGKSIGDFRTAVKEAIAGIKDYYGFMIVCDFIETGKHAQFYGFESSPAGAVDDRKLPQLVMKTSDDYNKLITPLTENPLASEFRVFKAEYTLAVSGQLPPYTFSGGIPRLKNFIEVTDLVIGYTIEQSRSDLADTLSLDVVDDEDGTYANYWEPMDVLLVYERVIGNETDNSFIKKGTFVIDSDPESVESSIPSLRVSARNCAKYGLLTSASGKWEAGLVEVAEATLTLVETTGDFRVYRHLLSSGEYSYNWNQNIPPGVYKYDGEGNKSPYTLQDGKIFAVYGDGAIYISTEYFTTSIDEGGMGSPATLYITYTRWKTPVDSFTDCNALHLVVKDVLEDAGFQHIDKTAINYIKSCMPVLTDFVFDRVYNYMYSDRVSYTGPLSYVDITGTIAEPKVQQETDTPKSYDPDMVALLAPGEMLYFMLTVDNHRFTHLYSNLRTVGVGGSFSWEIYNGSSWVAITPISSEETEFAGSWTAKETALDNWTRKCWQDSRWAYDQDDKASTFESGGVVAFNETDLTNWVAVKLSDLDPAVPVTSDVKGFWMRVRCTASPSSAIELHRFAGKELVVLPSDNDTNIVRIWDEKPHLELIDEWLGKLATPNYYLQINEHGDVETAYIMQQVIPAYELVNDFTVSRERDDSQIYTQVNVQLAEDTSRDSLVDYAKLAEGATVCYSGYATPSTPQEDLKVDYDYAPGNGYTFDQDDMIVWSDQDSNAHTGQYDPTYAIDQSLSSCFHLNFGGRRGPTGLYRNGKPMPTDYNTPALAERDVLIITLPNEVKLYRVSAKITGISCYSCEFSISVRAEAAGSDWVAAISRAQGTQDMSDVKSFDFTQDADPTLPSVKYIKVTINTPGPISERKRFSHTKPYSYCVGCKIYNIIAEGVAVGEAVYASATLGTTPPFDTAADVALMDKYRLRALNISDKSPYLTKIEDADAFALNTLREAYRLYDPLAVGSVNPYVQIGQTVRYLNSILSADKVNGALYVVEEISHQRGGEVNTRIVPYKS